MHCLSYIATSLLVSAGTAVWALPSATHSPAGRWANDPSDSLPTGYVTTKGTEFWLDHNPYYFSGANCYWLPQLVYESQYDEVYQLLQSIGVKVVRTWAFSMVTELPTDETTYYQYWVNGTSL